MDLFNIEVVPTSDGHSTWYLYYRGFLLCDTTQWNVASAYFSLINDINRLTKENGMASFAVFVDAINQDAAVGVIVSASNGGNGGQPKVIWKLPHEQVLGCHIGKRYKLTIDEYPNAPD